MIHRRIGGEIDLLELHRAHAERYPFLLESVAGHPQSGRYDILFAFPGEALELRDGQLAGPSGGGRDFLMALDDWARREGPPSDEAMRGLPFIGGWFVYCGYELGAQIEPSVDYPAAPGGLPTALAVRVPAAIIHDRQQACCHLLAEQDPAQIEQMAADLAAGGGEAEVSEARALRIDEDPPKRFLSGVERILDYLAAGDAFQVNLSRCWRVLLQDRDAAAAERLYRALRCHNPAPFAGLMAWQGSYLLSSSPERLASIDGQRVQTRPIAGTRPRGAHEQEDTRLKGDLIENLKERAEHVMLIDLERNALGRVCEPGSVEVSELMTLETYAHVHHIVSNVTGRLRHGVGAGDVIRAVFPGGTITGCPKVRAMQIIAELEGEGRGAYTGSMGYLGRDGRLDCNILIRSLVLRGNRAWLRAGAGIVADSDPAAELEETRAKARGLLRSLGLDG